MTTTKPDWAEEKALEIMADLAGGATISMPEWAWKVLWQEITTALRQARNDALEEAGMVLAPREPTSRMTRAGILVDGKLSLKMVEEIYRAMIDVAETGD